MGRTEKFFDAFNGQTFNIIDVFATAIIALGRQTFGIFIGKHRTLSLKHGFRHEILRSYQFDGILLSDKLLAYHLKEGRIAICQMAITTQDSSPDRKAKLITLILNAFQALGLKREAQGPQPKKNILSSSPKLALR
jgi:hypothetical protein